MTLVDTLFAGSIPEPNSGCWLWLGYLDKAGYPILTYKGKQWRGNRAAIGLQDTSRRACHNCNVRSCVNPAHIYNGTAYSNIVDMRKAGQHVGKPSKLTKEQVAEIRSSNLSLRKMAAKIGVSANLIKYVRSGGCNV